MMPDEFPVQTRRHSRDDLGDIPDLSAMPDPRASGLPSGFEGFAPRDASIEPGRDMLVNLPQPLPGVQPRSDAQQQADEFKDFFSSLPLGMRLGIAEQGGLPTLANQFMAQRQSAAQKQQAIKEQARQHDLQMIEKLMAGGHHEALLEYGKQNPESPALLIGQSLSKQSLADVIAGANEGMIPQEVLQRIVTKQATPTEIKAWGDTVVEARKANAKEQAKAHMLKTAMDTPKESRTPYQQQLADEHETALSLKASEIDLKKAQAEKARADALKPKEQDNSLINKVHERMFGVPWAQGTSGPGGTREKAEAHYWQASAAGRMGVNLAAPAKAEERSNLIKRDEFMKQDRLVQPPPGTSAGQTRTGDYVEMTDKQREEWSGIVNSGVTLSSLFDLVEPLVTATSPKDALKQYAKLSLGAVSKTNPQAATYMADSEAFSSRMARVFGSEVGVLTQGDVNRWKNALPTFGDTKQVLSEKKRVFMNIYNQTKQMYKKKIAGEDFSEDLVKMRQTALKEADKVGIAGKTTDEQFDILMGK